MVVDIICNTCGKDDRSRIDILTQGRKSCKCQQIRSKLELKVFKILEKHKFNFKKEYGYDDLRHIQPLRYDYCVFKDGKDYIIECDGIQHYYPTFGKISFERTLITDKIKNEYCLTNNIPLMRIPYNTKESIEDLILNFINS